MNNKRKTFSDDVDEISLLGSWSGDMTRTGSKIHTTTQLAITIHKGTSVEGTGSDGGKDGGEFDFKGTFQFSRLMFTKKFKSDEKELIACVADLSIDGEYLTGSWTSEEGDGSWQVRRIDQDKPSGLSPQSIPAQFATGTPEPQKSAPPTQPGEASQTEICPRCGTAKSGFGFCLNCGHTFEFS